MFLVLGSGCREAARLPAKAVQGAALALERIDDIHGGDRLAARVLRVRHGIADDVLQEHLEDPAGLLVDEARDALDTTTAREAADGGLGDALDVFEKRFWQPFVDMINSEVSTHLWKRLNLSDGQEVAKSLCKMRITTNIMRNKSNF